MNIRKYRGIPAVIALVMMLGIFFVSCSEPQQNVPGSVDTISVRVVDNMDAKTITPEGNVNISHYVITVVNEAEGINQSSDYLTKGSMFTVSNVPAGEWYATVDAYIDRGSETYVKVASDQSESQSVAAGANTTFTLVLDTLDAVLSGDVTLTLKMPTGVFEESSPFYYYYMIDGVADPEYSYISDTESLLSGNVLADGTATIVINSESIPLPQGAYTFMIAVFKNADDSAEPVFGETVWMGMDVMRLVNGLEAQGEINLDYGHGTNSDFDVNITDSIGDLIVPSVVDQKDVYDIPGGDPFVIEFEKDFADSQKVVWMLDGFPDDGSSIKLLSETTEEGHVQYSSIPLNSGRHVLTAIVYDTNTEMAVGSVTFQLNVDSGMEFGHSAPKRWTALLDIFSDDSPGYPGEKLAVGNEIVVGIDSSGTRARVFDVDDLLNGNLTAIAENVETGVTAAGYYAHSDIVFGNDLFVISSYSDLVVSHDGVTWDNPDLKANLPDKYKDMSMWFYNQTGVAVGNGMFVLSVKMADQANNKSYYGIISSEDGMNWEYSELPVEEKEYSGSFDNQPVFFAYDRFLIVTENGTVLSSFDGKTWLEDTEFGNLGELLMTAMGVEFLSPGQRFLGDESGIYTILGNERYLFVATGNPDELYRYDKKSKTLEAIWDYYSFISEPMTGYMAMPIVLYENVLAVTAAYYSIDNGTTWRQIEEIVNVSYSPRMSNMVYAYNRFWGAGGADLCYSDKF